MITAPAKGETQPSSHRDSRQDRQHRYRLFAKGLVWGLISLGVAVLLVAYGDLFGLAPQDLETGKFIVANIAGVVLILGGMVTRLVMMTLEVHAAVKTETASELFKEAIASLEKEQQASFAEKLAGMVADKGIGT